jgi:hypothetical protein
MDVPAACSRCTHDGEDHIHGDGLSCAHCALGPRSHAGGLACPSYAIRIAPWPGASCLVRGCDCFERGGYSPRAERSAR